MATDAGKMVASSFGKKKSKAPRTSITANERTWSVDIPVLARSMVKAGDKLIVAGPTKLYDENDAIQTLKDPSTAANAPAVKVADFSRSRRLNKLHADDEGGRGGLMSFTFRFVYVLMLSTV